MWGGRPRIPFYFPERSWDSYQFSRRVSPRHLWSSEIHEPLLVSRDVRHPVQMRRGTRVFSRVSREYSVIPSFCDMKHEPKFKPLQGNPAFFWVRPLDVNSTWDRTHTVPLSYLLLRENSTWAACWKLAHLFSQRQGISSNLQTICGAWNFLRAVVLKWIFI